MENLKELVKIKSDQCGDEIIEYLKEKLQSKAMEIKIVENKQDQKKSILIGVNTSLNDVCPHRAFRAH